MAEEQMITVGGEGGGRAWRGAVGGWGELTIEALDNCYHQGQQTVLPLHTHTLKTRSISNNMF